MLSDLEAFDVFANQIEMRVDAISVGGFLPGRQIMTSRQAITLFFGDDGEFTGISSVDLAPATHEITVEHSDDSMSITISKLRRAAVQAAATGQPVIVAKQKPRYRRATRP